MIYEQGKKKHYILAGLLAGLCLACKLYFFSLILPVIAHWRKAKKENKNGIEIWGEKKILLSFLICLLTFLLFNPFQALQPKNTFKETFVLNTPYPHFPYEMFILTHLSFVTLLAFWYKLPLLPLLLGSILPDIDSSRTLVGRLLNPISHFIYKRFAHRTITHSWVPLLFLLSLYLITREHFVLFFLIGYASHIFLDMFNTSGVAFLYPKKLYFVITDVEIRSFGRYDFLLCFVFTLLSWALFLTG